MNKLILLGALVSAGAASSGTLDDVRANGVLRCGVNSGLVGFATQDDAGDWQGFDVGLCRAVAASVLGDASAVEFIPTSNKTRFTALLSGQIDLLVRNTTLSASADANLDFPAINYYDGQGFLAPKALGATSAIDLFDKSVCIQASTTSALNLQEYFEKHNIGYTPIPVTSPAEAQEAYLSGRCDVYSSDLSGLAAIRATFETPSDHILLPEIISKEPLGPVVRDDDSEWAGVVRWVLNALIAAEELGVTSANVEELSQGDAKPEINRLLGTEGALGELLGLEADWAVGAIKAGGNYGELFEKNIGEHTPVGLTRGLNAQWINGGLLYSPPFR